MDQVFQAFEASDEVVMEEADAPSEPQLVTEAFQPDPGTILG